LNVQALEKLIQAERILNETYALLKDPKLLLAANQALHESHNALTNKLNENKQIKEEHKTMIQRTHTNLQAHKNAPITFPKKDTLIICDKNYNITKINADQLKKDIEQTKKLITQL